MRERERMIARIRQIRRVSKTADDAAKAPAGASGQDQLHALETRISHLEHALETRISHLEALVEGLQDSVHRESSRHAKRITELEARIHPGTLGKALSDDARVRGL